MNRKIRFIKAVVAGVIANSLFTSPLIAENKVIDFTNRESYYKEYCSVDKSVMVDADVEICEEFISYVQSKKDKANITIQEKENELSGLRKDLKSTDVVLRLEQLSVKKENLKSQIDSLNPIVDDLDSDMNVITKQIIVAQNKISEYEANKKNISPVYPNSKDVLLFAEYEQKIIIENKKIDELAIKRDAKGVEYSEFDTLIKEIEAKESEISVIEEEFKVLMLEFKEKEAEYMDQINSYIADTMETKKILESISTTLGIQQQSIGFKSPMRAGSYNLSAGSWFYPDSFGGGVHLGADFAAKIGTEIYAPANAIVLYTSNACEDNGYVGNACGYPGTAMGGNQAHLIMSVEGQLYAVSFSHMKKDSIVLKTGDLIQQGELIGQIGLSGNTSGPHTHIQMYKLNADSLKEFIEKWDGDLSFGTGFGNMGYANRCSSTKTQNCRVKAEDYLS